jgi:hypothetical protein
LRAHDGWPSFSGQDEVSSIQHLVIASGAKQSSAAPPFLDCFVASLLAMTSKWIDLKIIML